MTKAKFTTTSLPAETAQRVDDARAVLAPHWGNVSRTEFVNAAVEHYLAELADDGWDVDVPASPDAIEALGRGKLPWRPRADWALVDNTQNPPAVQLAIGRGPRGVGTLLVVAEVLPYMARTNYGSAMEMLREAGYAVDESREPDSMSDGRDMIPIRP